MMGFPLRRAIGRGRRLKRIRPLRPGGTVIPFPFLRPLRPIGQRLPTGITPSAPVNLRSGQLELRLAQSEEDVAAVQTLRYSVFYEEMSAEPTPEMAALRRDFDRFDSACDHLMVINHGVEEGEPAIVGTYRLMRRDAAQRVGKFYTQDEYNIRRLLRYRGELLELGRSCVHRDFRKQLTMNLLWRGISQYIQIHDVKLMFGCASFPGTDPAALAAQLSYLHYYHLAPPGMRPRAARSRYVPMARLAPGQFNEKAAKATLPPLIKGYLRAGCFVGDGAVVDHQFGTTDVCVVLKTELLTAKYLRPGFVDTIRPQ